MVVYRCVTLHRLTETNTRETEMGQDTKLRRENLKIHKINGTLLSDSTNHVTGAEKGSLLGSSMNIEYFD
jgi:hypothetical protein